MRSAHCVYCSADLLNFSETNSADSQTIHDCLINLISILKSVLPNLKACSSDGASVITGFKGGVAAKLREHYSLKHLLNADCNAIVWQWPVQTKVTS